MTWINLGDQDEITAGDLWRGKGGPTEDDDQLDKYFRIKSDRTLEAGFFDRDKEININTIDTVPSSNWHHVAMVLNKKYGFSIFLNGKQVANTNVPDPTNIDSHFVQEHKHAYTICGTDSSLNFDDYASTPVSYPPNTCNLFIDAIAWGMIAIMNRVTRALSLLLQNLNLVASIVFYQSFRTILLMILSLASLACIITAQ